jgi:hypothetical protein
MNNKTHNNNRINKTYSNKNSKSYNNINKNNNKNNLYFKITKNN